MFSYLHLKKLHELKQKLKDQYKMITEGCENLPAYFSLSLNFTRVNIKNAVNFLLFINFNCDALTANIF